MKIAFLIVRVLLGLVFFVFGLDKFVHFFPTRPPMPGPGGDFIGAMIATHYMVAIAALEVVGGLLLLIGRYVPLGLTLLGPIVVNILLFHVFMERMGIPIALVVTLLWLVTAWSVRDAFSGILRSRSAA